MRKFLALLICFWAFNLNAQNDLLAKNYFEQGDYEKAASLYKKLYNQNTSSYRYLLDYVKCLQQLEQFSEAQLVLEGYIAKATRPFPQLFIELGHNFTLQKQDTLAQQQYDKALIALQENPAYAYNVGETFLEYGLLEQAALTYETAMRLDNTRDYNAQLARIYGEQGALDKMFNTYLDLLEAKPSYTSIIKRNFSAYITEDPQNEPNIILKKTLLKRLQQNPLVYYNEFLSWLFIQQKEFKKAFIQEKAIYTRTQENMLAIKDLAYITVDEKRFEESKEIFQFIIDNAENQNQKLEAHQQILKIEIALAKKEDYTSIEKKYISLIEIFGNERNTYLLQIDYYEFVAFYLLDQNKAIEGLRNLAKNNLSAFEEARVKLKLADILVFNEKFNEALIYYSQVQNKVKNDVLAQEARFKVAQTSYFKGDFDWAQVQLDVLKKSTSQLIANDAMQLSLMIRDNTLEDSTQTALKKYARADLSALQNKNSEAISFLETILIEHKGEKIEDEALLKLASLYTLTNQQDKAIEQYQKIIDFYKDEITTDDAYFLLAELYENIQQEEKAKSLYEFIIFNLQDSIYFVEARKRYRRLRGDALN